MKLKLRPSLCLIVSALAINGAIAQPSRTPSASDWKAKFAYDYNVGNYRTAIADADALERIHALDGETAVVTAQAYYKAADYGGCAKYIREHFDVPKPDNALWGDKPAIGKLLERCQKS